MPKTLADALVEIYRRRWEAGDWRVFPATYPVLVLVLSSLGELKEKED